MTESPIYRPQSGVMPSAALVGGKAANLARLAAIGQPVPSFFALTTVAFHAALAGAPTAAQISATLDRLATADERDLRAAGEELRRLVREIPLTSEVDTAIRAAYRETFPTDDLVAVRSSAADEDAASQSFAGMHDSFLFLRGEEAVVDAVRRVWSSAFNERAIFYRRSQHLPLSGIAVAVVVQQMIDAETSGVMFTCEPATGNVHEIVVSSLYGAGEGLVGAGLAADTFAIDKHTSTVTRRQLVDKETQLRFDVARGQGLCNEVVPEPQRSAASLSDAELAEIARAGLDIERYFGRPQDIEFSLDANRRLFILQSRAVTRVEEYGPAADNELVWDNSNIIESYSGVTTPMTFSFIRRAYTIVYHCFAQVMGISPRVVQSHRGVFENMLGLFRGRVYYNLKNWYRLIRLFPGFQYNAPFMEAMMGVKEPLDLGDEAPPPSRLRRWFVELPALVRLLVRSSWNFLRIRSIAAGFQEHFHRHYDAWAKLDLRARKPHELMALYQEMEDALLWNWKAPIINDFYVMIMYGTLKKLCGQWCRDSTGGLQNDLICGEGGVESAQPAKMLLRLAKLAQDDAVLRELILREPLERLPARVGDDPRFAPFQALMRKYLDLYGFRCMNELKLEEYSLRDRPHVVYQVIRNYLALDDPAALDVAAMEQREQNIRREAEVRSDEALQRRGGLLPRRLIFRWVLHCARLGVKNRENMRFARTRIYGLLRELLRAMGHHLAGEGVLDDPEDVFYLTINELGDFVMGTAVTTDLRGLSNLRRAEYNRYRDPAAARPDDRFVTYGMAYHANALVNHRPRQQPSADGVLRGIGCSPGVVTGPVKVLHTPSDDVALNREILVAERTDPGWVPLYPAVSGILIERGSILSHSAVVAREMGIPTIVGIEGLLASIISSDTVTMDGTAGTVRVAKRCDVSAAAGVETSEN